MGTRALISYRTLVVALLLALLLLWGLAVLVTAPAVDAAGAARSLPAATLPLTITPEQARVGQQVQVTGQGLPAGKTVDLVWETVEGGWVVEEYYYFRGKKFVESTQSLGRYVVGTDGRLSARFVIPEDFGGVHNVVASLDGVTLAQGGIDVVQHFEMWPPSGPVGTMVELRGTGLGWRTMESTWVLNWDNREVGWISAVNTRGTATARFRATGPVGDHRVKVYTGYMGQSYLNYEQAPTAFLPRPEFVFRTTPGGAVPEAYAEPYVAQAVPPSVAPPGGWVGITPTQGPVGAMTELRGSGFPANETLTLYWQTMVGSRVTSSGFAPDGKVLGQVQTDASGSISSALTIPDDLGGRHALSLRLGEEELARAYFVIETSIVGIEPASGPVGTPVTIRLKGVGWTEYDNIYTANYDNAYMGYACGFNSQGDVTITFTASGSPGVHLIDLYPGIYQGPPQGQQLYRLPQLTYGDDHPGNLIPALRFAFTVTEE